MLAAVVVKGLVYTETALSTTESARPQPAGPYSASGRGTDRGPQFSMETVVFNGDSPVNH